MTVILFSGKAEAGKTTAATIVKNVLTGGGSRVAIIPYGDYVKHTAKLIFNWDGKKDEAGRELLQHWGTDVVREKNPSFWVDTVLRLAPLIEDEIDFLLIDDCRFPNEIDCWKDDAYDVLTVRINRPGWENSLTEEQRKHPSETSLDDYIFDIQITAADYHELYYEVCTQLILLIGELYS